MARLDSVEADNAIIDAARVGCGQLNGTGIDGARENDAGMEDARIDIAKAGNETRDDNELGVIEGVKVDIVISISKISLLVSFWFNVCAIHQDLQYKKQEQTADANSKIYEWNPNNVGQNKYRLLKFKPRSTIHPTENKIPQHQTKPIKYLYWLVASLIYVLFIKT